MLDWLGAWAEAAWNWVVIALFLALAGWESCRPARTSSTGTAPRWFTNISLYAVNTSLAALLIPAALSVILAAQLTPSLRPGSMFAERAGPWVALIACVLVLDLYAYVLHRIQHRVFLLWRFHSVHHADIDMDASTSVRHHPIEYASSTVIGTVIFTLLGIPEWVFPIYALSAISVSLIQHSNIRLPDRIERVVGSVVITPGLHQVHHSVLEADYDSNYGTVFTFWDRLFGTFRRESVASREGLAFGVLPFTGKRYTRFHWAWLLPFAIRGPDPARVLDVSEAD